MVKKLKEGLPVIIVTVVLNMIMLILATGYINSSERTNSIINNSASTDYVDVKVKKVDEKINSHIKDNDRRFEVIMQSKADKEDILEIKEIIIRMDNRIYEIYKNKK